ncbi:hypothetical protein FDECE_3342 [Fusarium decemcellulare]|nr:hypothetical protein FDECE_3342 [Fusarium decemcellulare]
MLSPAKLIVAAMAFATLGAAAPAEAETLNNLEARACPGGSYAKCFAQRTSHCTGTPPAGMSQCLNNWQRVCQTNC